MGSHPQSLDAVINIVRTLEEDIVLGRIYPRERLVEEPLAERFKQKRHVVRQALSDLEKIGLVVREAGKGATVREFSPEEVHHLYEMREFVEGKAAMLIQLPVSDEDLSEVEALCQTYSESLYGNDMQAVIETNKQFHRAVYSLCRNPFLIDVINNMAQRANLVRFSSSTDPALLELARREHFGILEALRGTSNDELRKRCVGHIQPSMQRYMALRARTERT